MTLYYVYPKKSTFANLDINELAKEHHIITLEFDWSKKIQIPIIFLKQLIHIIINLRKINSFIITFCGYHSIVPITIGKLFNIPVFIILNGSESVGIQHFHYGDLLRVPLKLVIKFSIFNATELWPVSTSLIMGSNNFGKLNIHFGLKYTFKNLTTPYHTIPNGFNINFWSENFSNNLRKKKIITVVSGKSQVYRKGIDIIFECARLDPTIKYTIVGMPRPSNLKFSNIDFVNNVSQTELKTLFNNHLFYIQISRFEGFGCSLAEAMLSGLIPIGSNVNSIPDIIGNNYLIINEDEPSALLGKIKSLMNLEETEINKISKDCSERIAKLFSIENRIDLIVKRIMYYQSKPT